MGRGHIVVAPAQLVVVISVRAKISGAVYCYRSCLWRAGVVCLLRVCYHDNSKLRESIFTKLGLEVKLVTVSS